MTNLVTVIDYGLNNIQSVIQALQFIGIKTKVATTPSEIDDANHIIIPGVGTFQEGMKKLNNLGLDEKIVSKSKQKTNILGICLGMQMLFSKGYEYGVCNGLNLIQGEVLQIQKEINNEKCLPVIGWRKTFCSKSNQKNVLAKFLNKKDFYYLHSYQVLPKNKDDIICYYERGGSKINAAITAGNIWGVQFHPEKSGEAGLEFLKAFSNLKINY